MQTPCSPEDTAVPGEGVLLHICCAACALGAMDALAREGFRVTGFFYNPNIHPLLEFRRRLKAVKCLRDRLKLDLHCDEQYGLDVFLGAAAGAERKDERCSRCYRLRLAGAAAKASELGLRLVTTTLFASPHQDVEMVARVGEEAARREGLEFLVRDFRRHHDEAHAKARAMKLYLQQYCGCIFSEYERYRDTGLHVYKGDCACPGR